MKGGGGGGQRRCGDDGGGVEGRGQSFRSWGARERDGMGWDGMEWDGMGCSLGRLCVGLIRFGSAMSLTSSSSSSSSQLMGLASPRGSHFGCVVCGGQPEDVDLFVGVVVRERLAGWLAGWLRGFRPTCFDVQRQTSPLVQCIPLSPSLPLPRPGSRDMRHET